MRRPFEGAIVDAYNEPEQAVGLFTMIEDNLKLPFDTEVLGVSVIVEKVDMTDADQIVAVCARAGKKQEIPIVSLRCLLRPRKDGSGSPPIVTGGEASNHRIPIL